MADIVVYGAGGMGKEVAETVLAVSRAEGLHRFLGFLDDREASWGSEVLGHPIVGGAGWLREHRETSVVLGFGHPWHRHEAVGRLGQVGARFATIIHPSAEISPSATLGEGTVVFAGCVVSSEARLGSFCYLNYRAIISHDVWADEHVCIMGHATIAGNVRIGEGTFIGAGVSTRQGVSIGEWSIIGAGAVVVRDIPPLCVAYGVPARPARSYAASNAMPSF